MATNVSMQTPIPDYGNFGQVIGNAIGRARQLKESTRQFDLGQVLQRQRLEEIERPTVALKEAGINLEQQKWDEGFAQRQKEHEAAEKEQKRRFNDDQEREEKPKQTGTSDLSKYFISLESFIDEFTTIFFRQLEDK